MLNFGYGLETWNTNGLFVAQSFRRLKGGNLWLTRGGSPLCSYWGALSRKGDVRAMARIRHVLDLTVVRG